MWHQLLVLVLMQILSLTEGHLTEKFSNLPNIEISMSNAIKDTVQDYYAKRTSQLFITFASSTAQGRRGQQDIINRIRQQTELLISFQVQDVKRVKDISSYPPTYNIFLIDHYESFEKIKILMKQEIFNLKGYYLVVITENYPDCDSIRQKIFQEFFDMFAVNVNILAQELPSSDVEMHTFFPFTNQHCYKVVPTLYDTFSTGTRRFNKSLLPFPAKTDNYYGCDFKVVTWNLPPHVYLWKPKNDSFLVDGIDGKVLQMLSEKMNFSIKVLPPPRNESVGLIYPNGTTTGTINMVVNGEANLTLGGLGVTAARAQAMLASISYFHTSMVFALPSTTEYTSFEKLFFPFKYIIWSLIGCTFIVGCLVTTILRYLGDTHRNFVTGGVSLFPFLDMFNVWMGGVLPDVPKRNFARTLLAIWLLSTLVLRGSYQGSLFQFLQKKQVVKPPEKISEVLAQDYDIYLTHSAIAFIPNIPLNRTKIMTGNLSKYLSKLNKPGFKAAILTTDIVIKYFNHLKSKENPVKILKEQLSTFPVAIYYKRNSYLKCPIDKVLNSYMQSGLIDHWTSKYIPKIELRRKKDSSFRKMSFNDFKGGFQLCVGLTLLSIFVFILELLSPFCSKLKKVLDFLNY